MYVNYNPQNSDNHIVAVNTEAFSDTSADELEFEFKNDGALMTIYEDDANIASVLISYQELIDIVIDSTIMEVVKMYDREQSKRRHPASRPSASA